MTRLLDEALSRNELTALIAATLFAAFLIGWIAHWVWARAARAASPREDRANELVAELLVVEEARDRALAEKRELEAALRGEAAETEALLQTRLREREAELEATMGALRAAREELEALRPG
ncbi:MAG: hypothetical protein AAFU55_05900 [Pseudomonadota bacterium]